MSIAHGFCLAAIWDSGLFWSPHGCQSVISLGPDPHMAQRDISWPCGNQEGQGHLGRVTSPGHIAIGTLPIPTLLIFLLAPWESALDAIPTGWGAAVLAAKTALSLRLPIPPQLGIRTNWGSPWLLQWRRVGKMGRSIPSLNGFHWEQIRFQAGTFLSAVYCALF